MIIGTQMALSLDKLKRQILCCKYVLVHIVFLEFQLSPNVRVMHCCNRDSSSHDLYIMASVIVP